MIGAVAMTEALLKAPELRAFVPPLCDGCTAPPEVRVRHILRQKVANRNARVWARGDREWSLNERQIPSREQTQDRSKLGLDVCVPVALKLTLRASGGPLHLPARLRPGRA
jgi:hypothetical protein